MTAEECQKRNADCRGDGQGEQQEGLEQGVVMLPNPPQKEPMPQETLRMNLVQDSGLYHCSIER